MPFGSTVPFVEPLWYSRGNSPYYKASHERLRAVVRKYVDESITPFCEEWETQGSVPKEVLKRHSELGYTAVTINPARAVKYIGTIKLPADIPPAEWDGFHDLICIDEIARCGYLGVIWALGCGDSIGCPPVVNYGTEAQNSASSRRSFGVKHDSAWASLSQMVPVPLLVLSFPLLFPWQDKTYLQRSTGSDVAGITTSAERKGDKYIVNGAKKWITNGMWADYCTAAVRTGGPGKAGISALIIPLSSQGVTRRHISNSGVHSSGSTYLEFDNVEVPIDNRLGEENQGFKIIMSNFNHERLWLACTSLRLARVCLSDAYAHAITRTTFNATLLSHQVIRNKFTALGAKILPAHALMESLVATAEATARTDRTSSQHDLDQGGLVALLKVVAAQALELAVREMQQVMGGLGYSRTGKGARVEQISRDVRVMVVGGGSEEILTELAFQQERRDLEDLKAAGAGGSKL